MAAFNVGSIIAKLKLDTSEFQGSIQGAQNSSSQLGSTLGSASDFAKKAGLAIAAVGAGVTAFAVASTKSTLDFASQSKTLSRQIGESVTETSRLLAGIERLGVSSDQASVAFGIFSKHISDSRDKTSDLALKHEQLQQQIDVTTQKIKDTTTEIKKNGDANGDLHIKLQGLQIDLKGYQAGLESVTDPLQKLGVATKNTDGTNRSFRDILLDVADKFKAMPDGIEKTAESMKLFGRSGKDMIPILDQGSQGIQDLEKKADELGITLTEKNVGQLAKYTQSMRDSKEAMSALKIQVGEQVIPVMTIFNKTVSDGLTSMLKVPEPLHSIVIGFLAFGGPVLTATGALVGFGANLAQIAQGLGPLLADIGKLSVVLRALPTAIAISVVVIGIYEVWQAWQQLQQIVGGLQKSASNAQDTVNELNKRIAETAPGPERDRLSSLRDATQKAADAAQLASDKYSGVHGALQFLADGLPKPVGQILDSVGQMIASFDIMYNKSVNDFQGFEHAVVNSVAGAYRGITNWIGAIPGFMAGVVRDIANIFNDVTNAIVSPFSRAYNAVAGIFSSLKNVGSSAVSQVKHILGFATGTTNFTGGMALVGEQGPELVRLPQGADVIPNKDIGKNLQGGGVSLTVNGDLNMGSDYDVDQFMKRVQRNIELSNKGLSPV